MSHGSYRPHRSGVAQSLGELEAKIMEHLWQHGPMSVTELHAALDATSRLAYTTVFTELSRLLKKKLVRKRGKHMETTYAAAARREDFVNTLVSQVLSGLIEAHGHAAVHGFVELIADDDDAVDEVHRLLGEHRRNRT